MLAESESIMKRIMDDHICEMIVNDDGSFTFKFDGEETWRTKTDAKKLAEVDNAFEAIFNVYFKGILDRLHFHEQVERYRDVI